MNKIRNKKGQFIKNHLLTFQATGSTNPMWKGGLSKDTKYIRERHNKWRREREKIDLEFKIGRRIEKSIYDFLTKNKQSIKWKNLIDYTIKDLIKHLEQQFDDKMNWNNYGNYWEIDHIKPKHSFTIKEFKECWSLKNLRPLKISENRRKGRHWLASKSCWGK
jgi:hypothetical protein